jgi:hypothetical protein
MAALLSAARPNQHVWHVTTVAVGLQPVQLEALPAAACFAVLQFAPSYSDYVLYSNGGPADNVKRKKFRGQKGVGGVCVVTYTQSSLSHSNLVTGGSLLLRLSMELYTEQPQQWCMPVCR